MDQNIGGLQLALFELIWPAYPWINYICLVDHPSISTLYIQALTPQGPNEQEACIVSLSEVLKLWRPDCLTTVCFEMPTKEVGTIIDVMSTEIFALMAAEIAPWRLALGDRVTSSLGPTEPSPG